MLLDDGKLVENYIVAVTDVDDDEIWIRIDKWVLFRQRALQIWLWLGVLVGKSLREADLKLIETIAVSSPVVLGVYIFLMYIGADEYA